jgi:flagellar biosynthetic protein FlhB
LAEQEDAFKTEDPTPRRLHKGRQRGQVAVSQDVKAWGVLVGGAIAVAYLLPGMNGRLLPLLTRYIAAPEVMVIDRTSATPAFAGALLEIAWAIAPVIGVLLAFAAAANLVQVGLMWAPSRAKPDFSRLSPVAGLRRMISANAGIEFVKCLVKLAVVTAVVWYAGAPAFAGLDALPDFPVGSAVFQMHKLVITIVGGSAAAMTVIALGDYGVQRFRFLQQMRMTKQEVREEYRETEGDPHIKARIRRLRMERSRQRMMQAVRDADVVITNPTHYAVALAYKPEAMAAPRVVAKGADHMAMRIREIADTYRVPRVENPALARSLYRSLDIDQEIPPEHYKAVAEVIAFIMRRQRPPASH